MFPASDQQNFSDGLGAVVDDRRMAERRSERLGIQVTAMGRQGQHACTIHDISENGLFLRVPASAGLMVGERCEVAFGDKPESAALAGLAGESCFATVVRTAAVEDEKNEVGAGLRFDQPLYF